MFSYIRLIFVFSLLLFPYRVFAYEYSCGCMTVDYFLDMDVDSCQSFVDSDQAIAARDASAGDTYTRLSFSSSKGFLKANVYRNDSDYSVDFFAYCDCSARVSELSSQCSEEDIVWSDPGTCSGDCLDPCEEAAYEECGDKSSVVWEDRPACKYHCLTCQDKATEKCGGAEEVEWLSPANCVYTCKDPCQDQNPTPSEDCGTTANVEWIDEERCLWKCLCSNYIGGEPIFHFPTCESVPPDSPCDTITSECPLGYVSKDWETCEAVCITCGDQEISCETSCKNGGRLANCSESGAGSIGICICNDDPVDEPSVDPGPDDPGESPDPGSPDDPDNNKTCADYQAQCSSSCQFVCSADSSGGVAYHNCDCGGGDPSDPNDGNGWLKEIEENTDRTANNTDKANGWLKSIKGNTDGLLEDTHNISKDVRAGVANDKRYFLDGSGRSVFKDRTGKSYLQIIAEKDFSAEINVGSSGSDINVEVELPGDVTVDIGEIVLPEDNEYSSSLDEVGEDGKRVLDPLPESTFETDLTSYIASGIPLFDYIKNTSIDLSSASPVLSLNILGQPVSVDFSRYEATINKAGDILFYLVVISCFILIITRAKG